MFGVNPFHCASGTGELLCILQMKANVFIMGIDLGFNPLCLMVEYYGNIVRDSLCSIDGMKKHRFSADGMEDFWGV